MPCVHVLGTSTDADVAGHEATVRSSLSVVCAHPQPDKCHTTYLPETALYYYSSFKMMNLKKKIIAQYIYLYLKCNDLWVKTLYGYMYVNDDFKIYIVIISKLKKILNLLHKSNTLKKNQKTCEGECADCDCVSSGIIDINQPA